MRTQRIFERDTPRRTSRGSVAGIELDADDVETVAVYRLRR
jgi:hypothetical protein